MKNTKLTIVLAVLAVIALAFTACSPKPEEAAAAAPAPTPQPAVSDGSEDLIIDARINYAGTDEDNYFNWKGNVRYMAAQDSYDAVSGASVAGSTSLFMMYLYDVEAKEAMPSGLRGLFLFGVNGADQVQADKVEAMEDGGTITVQYVHRGTAYRFTTDGNGVLSLPDGTMEMRRIGTPDGYEEEFSSDGTGAGVDYEKVWSSDVSPMGPNPEAMYFWDGDLQFAVDGDVLTIKGILTAVER